MTRRASLAMYDPGGAAPAALWAAIGDRLAAEGVADVPRELDVPDDYEAHWLDPDLLVAHTCGYPLTHALAARVRYVGVPTYDVPGTDGPYYRSAIVVRADEPEDELAAFRNRITAYNGPTSQSGYNAFRLLIAPLSRNGRFFSQVIETGSHSNSLVSVIRGEADIAAIDPVTLALQPSDRRAQVRIIAWTEAAPGLPLITGLGASDTDSAALGSAFSDVLQDRALKPILDHLKLAGFARPAETSYSAILDMERRSRDAGYPALA